MASQRMTPGGPVRWVLHRHEVAGGLGQGTWHYDWMVGPWPGLGGGADGQADPDALVLRSWRVMVDPRVAERFEGEDGPDHRRAYLDVESRVLDGGRGTVRRVGGGVAEVVEAGRDRVVVRVWDGQSEESAVVELVGERVAGRPSVWRFGRG